MALPQGYFATNRFFFGVCRGRWTSIPCGGLVAPPAGRWSCAPEDEEALVVRGLTFEALGRRDEAVVDFPRALALNAGALPEIPRCQQALKRLDADP
jgi:hypothetical protein